ncbi:MFS transporter [Amycolatopsis sp. WAC 01416]|uniref:MFS transporter n=1 Tax=Amycolatopsis sp. WAC 01416 TaxID=2203196 RepID=UPI000F788DE8|nr:MFS transporter [Amycolatopsis sp. WAC 01416]RSN34667.1 MFS transporter [Amycolatopsis sp. WAC 01416]
MNATVRLVAAASTGNMLEWLSFTAYALVADVIARQFFPSADPVTSLMLALGTAVAAYLARPIGAVVLGVYADRAGRLAALTVAIRLMTLGSFLIVILPDYGTIGVLAPIGMLLALVLQGFSAGGEFGSATALLVESHAGRRGFMGSWQTASQAFAVLLATGLLATTSGFLSPAQFDAWGWRIPFAVALLLGPAGYFIRTRLRDSPEFIAARAKPDSGPPRPLVHLMRHHKTRVLLVMGMIAVSTGFSYLITYMPTFAIRHLGMSPSTSFTATFVTGVVLTVLTPVAGHLSDRIGRARMLTAAAAVIALISLPLFLLIRAAPAMVTLVTALALMGLVKAWYAGPLPAAMAEMFPVSGRGTGLSISYNLGVILFGGVTPLAITLLIAVTGSTLAPSYWITALALLSGICVVLARRYRQSAPSSTLEGADGGLRRV